MILTAIIPLCSLVLCLSCNDPDDLHRTDNPSNNEGLKDGKIIVETGDAEPGSCFAKAYGKISGTKGAVEVGFLFGGNRDLSFENGSKHVSTTAVSNYWITIKGLVDDCVNYYRAYALVDGKYYYGEIKYVETYGLTYSINGKEFLMVKVEDGDMGNFSIMQTEVPVDGMFEILGVQVQYDYGTYDKGYIRHYELLNFIDKLREVTGLEFRLPLAEEWVYASVGGKYSKGYLYSGSNDIDEVAWYSGNSGSRAHPVAQKKSNELGLYDMSGNYAELIQEIGQGYSYIDGPLYGGNYVKDKYSCKANSWYFGNSSSNKIQYTDLTHKGGMDKMETVRLVYSRY